jgi:hypothetical protein
LKNRHIGDTSIIVFHVAAVAPEIKKAPKPITYRPSDPYHFLCAIRMQSLTIK